MSGLTTVARWIDRLNEWIGRGAAWLSLLIVLVTASNVLLRYLFRKTSVGFQELEWHLFGPLFMLTAAYTLMRDEHVRVDVFYSRWSPRRRAVVNLAGALLLLIPVCAVVGWTSLSFVAASWAAGEGSPDPGGLPGRYVLKAIIPVSVGLLGLQGLSQALHSLQQWRDAPASSTAGEGEA